MVTLPKIIYTCSHCNQEKRDTIFLAKIQNIYNWAQREPIATSGYRCPVHNQTISTTGLDGSHTKGLAIDFHFRDGAELHDLVFLLLTQGFIRIFLYKSKPHLLHVDLDYTKPNPRLEVLP